MIYAMAPSLQVSFDRIKPFKRPAADLPDFFLDQAYIDFAKHNLASAQNSPDQIIYLQYHGTTRCVGLAKIGRVRQQQHDAAIPDGLLWERPVNQQMGAYMRRNSLTGKDFDARVVCNPSINSRLPFEDGRRFLFQLCRIASCPLILTANKHEGGILMLRRAFDYPPTTATFGHFSLDQ